MYLKEHITVEYFDCPLTNKVSRVTKQLSGNRLKNLIFEINILHSFQQFCKAKVVNYERNLCFLYDLFIYRTVCEKFHQFFCKLKFNHVTSGQTNHGPYVL